MNIFKNLFFPKKNGVSKNENLDLRKKVFLTFINEQLQKKEMNIRDIRDLTDGIFFPALIEILWGDKFDENIKSDPKTNEDKISNLKSVLEHLKRKQKITIPDYNLERIVRKKDTNNLLNIIWLIVYTHSIKWISYYGVQGEEGLLQWCNRCSDKNIDNFSSSWDDGKVFYDILNYYCPNDSSNNSGNENNNLNDIDIESTLNSLRHIGAPIYINSDDLKNKDELSIIFQCALLFNFFSSFSLFKSPEENIGENQADFYSGQITEQDMQKFVANESIVNINLNNYFQPVFHSRYPIQVAKINIDEDKHLSVEFKFKEIDEVIKRAGSRPIIFVSCLGRYQQGKTTLISGLTGNIAHKTGNGIKETTDGVYIDGPYGVDYLYQRFHINQREDIYYSGNEILAPLIFFFDIEGYEGNMHGNDLKANNDVYIEMCTPFLCLSSIFIFLSDINAPNREITDLFERMKVSNLTTYSNDDDSNGSLSLHIVFNRYNKFHDKLNTNNNTTFDQIIKDFQDDFDKTWIGVRPLKNYGIKYKFLPILEGLRHYFQDCSFYDVFQYFAENIIRSIEDAAEGSFIRCGQQSIDLFNYIIQHFNEPNFDVNIKRIIKEQHENSFETIAIRAYQNSQRRIFPNIDHDFEHYKENLSISFNIDDIIRHYCTLGEREINDALFKVRDHQSVVEYIHNFILDITKHIDEKNDNYKDFKNQKLNEMKQQINTAAEDKITDSINKIKRKLSENNNYNFDKTQINPLIQNEADELNTYLIQYKTNNNLFLLTDNIINEIFLHKKASIENNINSIIDKNIKEIQENEIQNRLDFLFKEELLRLTRLISNAQIKLVRNNLENKEYYKSYYMNINHLVIEREQIVFNSIVDQKNQIVQKYCDLLSEDNEDNKAAIERLKSKNMININNDDIMSNINFRRKIFSNEISKLFNRAKDALTEIIVQSRKKSCSWIKVSIEVREITIYPDDTRKTSDWKSIRKQNKSFKEFFCGVDGTIHERYNK